MQPDQSEQFVRHLTESQNRLYGYVYSLLGDHARAADVVQETNLVLWRKIEEFKADKPFLPWAFAVARYQVLAHLRDHGRDKVLLDQSLIELVSPHAEQEAVNLESKQTALRSCLDKLPEQHRDLIRGFYFRSQSVNQLAEQLGKSVSAIKTALLRSRRQLAECVERNN